MSVTAKRAAAHRRDKTTTKLFGVLCALTAVALFSGFTLMSRLGQMAGLKAFDLAALRFGIGGLVLLPIFLRFGISGLSFGRALSIAFLGGLGFALLAYAGISLAPAAHGAALLHGTLPLSTALIVLLIDPSQARRKAVPGVILIGLGIALMVWDSLREAGIRQLAGDGLLLLASLSLSAYGVSTRRLAVPPVQAVAMVAVISMVCFLPPYLALRGDALFAVGWRELLVQSLFQGILIGALSIFAYTRAVASLGATETALFTAAVPGITTLGAIPLLSEWPGVSAWTGVGIVTAGMLVAVQGMSGEARASAMSGKRSIHPSSEPQYPGAGPSGTRRRSTGYPSRSPVVGPFKHIEAQEPQRESRSINIFVRAILAVLEWWDRRRTLGVLRSLNDRTLKDIGLSRSGLWEAAAGAAAERRLKRIQKLGRRATNPRTANDTTDCAEPRRDSDCEPNRNWRPNFWI